MLLTKSVQEKVFLAVAFLFGSVAPLYGNVFNFILLGYVLLLGITRRQEFIQDLKKERVYLTVIVVYLFYITIHTLVMLGMGNPIAKPSYGVFEMLIFAFVLVPVYVTTFRSWLTPRLLERFFLCFCVGCLLLNIYIVFHLIGDKLFTETGEAVRFLYNTRFGDNKKLLGGSLDLEPQALFLAMSASMAYFLFIIRQRVWVKIGYVVLFFMLLLFLSFTVTKGSIFAFFVGFIILNIYIFRQQSWRVRLILGACLVVCMGILIEVDTSQKYHERFVELKEETGDAMQGDYKGTTIGPRVAFLRESFKHVDEYAVLGLGVCAKNRVKAWYESSDAGIGQYHNLHNTFVQNWVQGGLFGLGVTLFLFLAPVVRMWRRRRFSYLVVALILMVAITSTSCIMLSLTNSRSLILFLFAMFYFYGDTFVQLEDRIRKD